MRPCPGTHAQVFNCEFSGTGQVQSCGAGAVLVYAGDFIANYVAAIANHLLRQPLNHLVRVGNPVPAVPEHRLVDILRQVGFDLTGFIAGQFASGKSVFGAQRPPAAIAVVLFGRAVEVQAVIHRQKFRRACMGQNGPVIFQCPHAQLGSQRGDFLHPGR